MKVLSNIELPLPSLEIQDKLIEELDTYQRIVNASKIIIQSYLPLIRIDSDTPMVKLGEILKRVNDTVDPTKENGSIEYVGLENIVSREGALTGSTKTDYGNIKSLKNRFKKGDILYGKLRPNLNKVWLADRDGIASTDILVLRTVSDCSPKYYASYMLTKEFNMEVLRGLKGAQLPRVSFSHMETISVPKPTLDLQNNIAQDLLKQTETINGNRELAKIYNNKIQSRINEIWI